MIKLRRLTVFSYMSEHPSHLFNNLCSKEHYIYLTHTAHEMR